MELDEETLKKIESEEFYHGFLPREDISSMLKEVGDFILRLTQPKPGDPRELVISVRASMEPSSLSIRHVILTRKVRNGGFDWIAIEDEKYSSLKELINDYVTSGRPINPEYKTSILIRGIKRQTWEFSHEDVEMKDILGEGQYGEVRAGFLNTRGKKMEVAIKIAKQVNDEKQLEQKKDKIKEMMHEARIMRELNHINIVRMYGVAVCREPIMIILEKVNGGSLFDLLDRKKGQICGEEKIENMSLGAARGLEYLHSQRCIHRDIASRNVLYTDRKVAKISDFGMSRQGTLYEMKKGSHKRIPLKWTAPESMVAFQYTPKTDVFSYSILLWEIFSDAAEPYAGLTCLEVKKMVSCGQRLKRPQCCPDEMFKLMCRCWAQNPVKRYTMSEVVKFIEGVLDGADETQHRTACETQLKDEIDDEESLSTSRSSKRLNIRRHKKKGGNKMKRRRRPYTNKGK
uniref:Tyrosine-protein kinase n=1 Tax=Ascaris suum TaxID=6253 RepID=F1L167_ASCSU